MVDFRRRWLSVWLIFLLVATFLPVSARAGSAFDPDERLQRTLLHAVAAMEKKPETAGMSVAFDVVSLRDQRVVASRLPEKALVPGAVSKLWTAGAVLNAWPESLRFPTELYTEGETFRGELRGDIVLKGKGDPSLRISDLDKLARTLRRKGIRRVTGNVVVDDSYFDQIPLGTSWMWDEEPYPKSAQNGALSVEGNTVDIRVMPGWPGRKPRVAVAPVPAYVQVVNRAVTTFGRGESLSITRTRAKNEIVVTGSIGVAHPAVKERRTVKDPALFTGTVLKERMERAGIRFSRDTRVIRGDAPAGGSRVAWTKSPILGDLLKKMVKPGDNLTAEMLLKQLGAREGEEGSEEEGLRVLRRFAAEKTGASDTFQPKDGSGFSRMSVMTPRHLTGLLSAMERHQGRERFFSLLSDVGEGPLTGRMERTPAAGRLRALAVDMEGVSGLTGIVKTCSGESFAFSVMVNGVDQEAAANVLEDRFGTALASYPSLADPGPLPKEKTYPLSAKLDPLLDSPGYEGILTGMSVRSVENGEELYERNGGARLTPASNTKLFTSAAALHALGSDYRFHTQLFAAGSLQNGVLKGDLILRGKGDPTLATEDSLRVQKGPTLEQMARDLKERGLRRIEGNVRVDTSAFSDPVYGRGWAWDNESEYYQPQITALNLNRGTVRFDYQPGDKEGDPVKLSMIPETAYVDVEKDVTTGPAGSKNTLKIERIRGTNHIRLTGSLPLDFKGDYTRVPVEEPHRYAGTVLKEALLREGIEVTSDDPPEEGWVSPRAKQLADYPSPPLGEVVQYLNKVSDNFYAEMILKTLGLEKRGTGTAAAGLKEVDAYLRGIGKQGAYRMEDGSGLTRYNVFSPQQLVSLLAVQKEEDHFDAFYHSLPVAGKDGTLRSRMKGTPAQDNLRGKTGSLTHVSSLSGYVRSKDGELLAYSIVMNGYTEKSERALQDKIAVVLAEFSR
ncbi:D-alanyl-D-alanine carboxypeptidase/D-alanyl-D-alanine endopeptidase [Salinithrix halophila]|uniref:D-alanyl-D-alanine carboxypeptidase/D-alanyl-D-alanine-endopeptidase n=1 Tax=Salinithrix halophila TaxID=1485204 RepID=A0ABV8JK32_9BACL